MPLSYCSIAWAIQPTVRPRMKSASAAFRGRASAVAAAARAIDIRVTSGQTRSSGRCAFDEGPGFRECLRNSRQDRCRARVAGWPEEVTKTGQVFAAREAAGDYGHCIAASAE